MKKFTLFSLLTVIFILTGAYISSHFSTPLASAQSYNILRATVSTGVTVGTSSTKLLDAASSRIYAVIVNDSAEPVYISLDGKAAVLGKGIRLNATGGSYEINSLNQFAAQINAISTSGGDNVTVTADQ